MAAHEAPEALAELEDRRRERVLGEPVASRARDALAPRFHEWISRRRERELVDDEERQRLPLDVDPLPEGLRGHEDRVDLVAEALEEALPRRVALDQHGE